MCIDQTAKGVHIALARERDEAALFAPVHRVTICGRR
jgi:hypothetical protein